jgi:hypothetical protein
MERMEKKPTSGGIRIRLTQGRVGIKRYGRKPITNKNRTVLIMRMMMRKVQVSILKDEDTDRRKMDSLSI